jgi:hypothetical protein
MSQKAKNTFNGHRSWNAWNVSLHLSNDYGMCKLICDLVKQHGKQEAAEVLFNIIGGSRTPDGGTYNRTAIREALRYWQ